MHTRERQASLGASSGPINTTAVTTERKAFKQAKSPEITTATASFFGGTTDGKRAEIDFTPGATHLHNIKPPVDAQVTVTDIRHFDPPCSLDVEGCQWIHAPTGLTDALEGAGPKKAKEYIEGTYWAECAEVVKKATGATKTQAYQFRYRQMKPETNVKDHHDTSTKPVQNFHVDNDDETAEAALRKVLGDEEAEEWMKGRWGIVNLWRPVGKAIEQWPLAVIDSTAHDWNNTVPVHTKNNYKGYTLLLPPSEDYNFYYVKNLAPDECLMFKNYQSNPDGSRFRVAHGAFLDHAHPDKGFLRRSVEVRVVFKYD